MMTEKRKEGLGATKAIFHISARSQIIFYTISAVMISLLVLVLLAVIISNKNGEPPFLFDRSMLIVVSDSMKDTIPKGSIILIKRVDGATLNPGDIITFKDGYDDNNKTLINTHRITRKEQTQNGFVFSTKGDNNNLEDLKRRNENDILGKVEFIIPALGNFMTFVKSPMGLTCCIAVPLMILLFFEVFNLFKMSKEKEPKNEQRADGFGGHSGNPSKPPKKSRRDNLSNGGKVEPLGINNIPIRKLDTTLYGADEFKSKRTPKDPRIAVKTDDADFSNYKITTAKEDKSNKKKLFKNKDKKKQKVDETPNEEPFRITTVKDEEILNPPPKIITVAQDEPEEPDPIVIDVVGEKEIDLSELIQEHQITTAVEDEAPPYQITTVKEDEEEDLARRLNDIKITLADEDEQPRPNFEIVTISEDEFVRQIRENKITTYQDYDKIRPPYSITTAGVDDIMRKISDIQITTIKEDEPEKPAYQISTLAEDEDALQMSQIKIITFKEYEKMGSAFSITTLEDDAIRLIRDFKVTTLNDDEPQSQEEDLSSKIRNFKIVTASDEELMNPPYKITTSEEDEAKVREIREHKILTLADEEAEKEQHIITTLQDELNEQAREAEILIPIGFSIIYPRDISEVFDLENNSEDFDDFSEIDFEVINTKVEERKIATEIITTKTDEENKRNANFISRLVNRVIKRTDDVTSEQQVEEVKENVEQNILTVDNKDYGFEFSALNDEFIETLKKINIKQKEKDKNTTE